MNVAPTEEQIATPGARQSGEASLPFSGEASRPRELLPAERVALTVALRQTLEGREVLPNTAAVCILALARLAGVHDWTKYAEIEVLP